MTHYTLCADFNTTTNNTSALKTIATKMLHMYSVSRQRHMLSNLSTHQLADIGLTSQAAQQESSRPFWDLP